MFKTFICFSSVSVSFNFFSFSSNVYLFGFSLLNKIGFNRFQSLCHRSHVGCIKAGWEIQLRHLSLLFFFISNVSTKSLSPFQTKSGVFHFTFLFVSLHENVKIEHFCGCGHAHACTRLEIPIKIAGLNIIMAARINGVASIYWNHRFYLLLLLLFFFCSHFISLKEIIVHEIPVKRSQ